MTGYGPHGSQATSTTDLIVLASAPSVVITADKTTALLDENVTFTVTLPDGFSEYDFGLDSALGIISAIKSTSTDCNDAYSSLVVGPFMATNIFADTTNTLTTSFNESGVYNVTVCHRNIIRSDLLCTNANFTVSFARRLIWLQVE